MGHNLKHTKICELITELISNYISERYVDVMFDDVDYIYFVKIKNQFGVAEYKFVWSMVMIYGVNYVVNTIKTDFIPTKECEE